MRLLRSLIAMSIISLLLWAILVWGWLGCVAHAGAVQRATTSTVLTFMLPSWSGAALTGGPCEATGPQAEWEPALSDLNRVHLWGVSRYTRDRVLIRQKEVRMREGERDTLALPELSGVWALFVTTTDYSGNESCWSNLYLHIGN